MDHTGTSRSPAPALDGSLLVAFAAREDARALQSLFTATYPLVHRLMLRWVGDPGLAQDLAQDTFVRILAKSATYREEGRFRAWVCRVALNEVRQHWRKENRRPRTTRLDHLVATLVDRKPASHEAILSREQSTALQEALLRLDPELRVPVVLHYDQQMTVRDVARVLGVPRATAHDRCKRGLAALRKDLEARNQSRALGPWVAATTATPLLAPWSIGTLLALCIGAGSWWFLAPRSAPSPTPAPSPMAQASAEQPDTPALAVRAVSQSAEAIRAPSAPTTSPAPTGGSRHDAPTRSTRVRIELPAAVPPEGLHVQPRTATGELLSSKAIPLEADGHVRLPLAGGFVRLVTRTGERFVGAGSRTDAQGRFRLYTPLVAWNEPLLLRALSGEYRPPRGVPVERGDSTSMARARCRRSPLTCPKLGATSNWHRQGRSGTCSGSPQDLESPQRRRLGVTSEGQSPWLHPGHRC